MTDERHVFIEDVTQRSRNAKGYYNSNGKQRPMAIDQSKLPEAVTNERDGECTSVQLDRPMTKDKFLDLSADLKVEYLNHLIDKYGVGKPSIDKMLGTGNGWLDQYVKTKMPNLATRIHKGSPHPTREQKKAWEEFCRSYREEKPLRGEALVNHSIIRMDKGDTVDAIARDLGMTPRMFRMFFQEGYRQVLNDPMAKERIKICLLKVKDPVHIMSQLLSTTRDKWDCLNSLVVEDNKQYLKSMADSDISKEEKTAVTNTALAGFEETHGKTVGEILAAIEEKNKTPVMSFKEWEDKLGIQHKKTRLPFDESAIAPSSMQLQFASVDNWESLFDTLRGIPLPKNAMITIQVRESVTGEV